MRIALLSDLHLEFSGGKFPGYTPPVNADVIVIAGDTHPGVLGLLWAAETFGSAQGMPVICTAGNHEFYHGRRLHKHYDKMRAKADELGIYFLQNDVIVIGGVRFLGGTLWTDFNLHGNAPLAMIDAQMSMNDYGTIRQGSNAGRPLIPATVLNEHQKTIAFLIDELSKDFDGKTVVVTHHAPSEQSCLPEYSGDNLNPSYATNLEGLMHAYDIELWLHGHVHQSKDYMISGTRVVCNPRGYADEALNPHFDPTLILEV